MKARQNKSTEFPFSVTKPLRCRRILELYMFDGRLSLLTRWLRSGIRCLKQPHLVSTCSDSFTPQVSAAGLSAAGCPDLVQTSVLEQLETTSLLYFIFHLRILLKAMKKNSRIIVIRFCHFLMMFFLLFLLLLPSSSKWSGSCWFFFCHHVVYTKFLYVCLYLVLKVTILYLGLTCTIRVLNGLVVLCSCTT